MILYTLETLALTSIKYLSTLKIFHDWAKDYNGFYTLCYGVIPYFNIWVIISVFFAFFFCTFLCTIGTGFFRWFQRNPPFLSLSKTDRDTSHFVSLPTAFPVYSSLGIKLRNLKFNAQKGINCSRHAPQPPVLWNFGSDILQHMLGACKMLHKISLVKAYQ